MWGVNVEGVKIVSDTKFKVSDCIVDVIVAWCQGGIHKYSDCSGDHAGKSRYGHGGWLQGCGIDS